MKFKRARRDQGSALVLVLVFVTIFSVIVGSSLLMVSSSSGQLRKSQESINLQSASASATARILGEIENSENLTSGSASSENCGLNQSTFTIAGVEYIASCTPGADSGVTAALDALVLTGTDGFTGDLVASSIVSGQGTMTIIVPTTAGIRVGDTFVLSNTSSNSLNNNPGPYTITNIKINANGENSIQAKVPNNVNGNSNSGKVTITPSAQVPGSKFTIESTTAVSFNYNSQKYSIGGLSAKGAINIPESKENPYINVKNASGRWNVDTASSGKFTLKGNGTVEVPSNRGSGCTPLAGVSYPHCIATTNDLSLAAANKTYWSQLLRSIEAANGVISRADGGSSANLFTCVAGSGSVTLKPGYYDYSDLEELNGLTANYRTDSRGKLVLNPLGTDGQPCSAFSGGGRPKIQMNPGTYLFDFSSGAPSGATLSQLRWLVGHDSYNRSFEIKGNPSVGGIYNTQKGKCEYAKDSPRDEYLKQAANRNGIQVQLSGGSSIENHGYFEICPTNYKNRIRTSIVALNTNEALNLGISTIQSAYGSVSGGDLVTITGSGFEAGARVKIGNKFAKDVKIKSSTLMTVVTDAHSASKTPEDVIIYNLNGQTATFASAFTYMATLNTLSPNVGPVAGGTLVTVKGGGFTSDTTVKVAGVDVPAGDITTSTDGSTITFLTPARSASITAVDVVITSGGNTYQLTNSFTYVPVINSVSSGQGSAAGGTEIQITGTGFSSSVQVFLDTTAAINQATSVSISNGVITATTPAHAVGKVNVIVMNADGQLATFTQGYTYLPVVTSITSAQGSTAGGDVVTIYGKGFTSGTTFKFGTRSATGVTCLTTESCTAVVPSATSAGTVDLTATISGQSVVFTSAFTYVSPAAYSGPSALDPASSATNTTTISESSTNTSVLTPVAGSNSPLITSLSSSSGSVAGGTSLTITGNRFDSGSTVFFDTLKLTVTGFTATTLTVTVPARVAGIVDVTVTNSNGLSATLTNGYEYKLTAALTPLTKPATSPATCTNTPWSGGGCTLIITGTGFDSSATVTIGGTAATSVVVNSSTSMTVTVPPHAAGLVSIVVAQQGSTVTLTNAFTYYHSIRTIRGSTGWTGGGDSVDLTGVGFGSDPAAVTVMFGTQRATVTSVSALDSIQDVITVTTPSYASASTIDVVVTVNGVSRTFTGAFTYSTSKGGQTTTKSNTDTSITPLLTAVPTYNWQNAVATPVITAAVGNASLSVTITTAAGFNGSKVVTDYLYELSTNGGTTWGTPVSTGVKTATSFTINGLTNGTAYTIRVRAADNSAPASYSAYSNLVTKIPNVAPTAPTSVSATRGVNSATVTFTAPVLVNGSTIESYTVTSTPGGIKATGAGSSITVSGLTAGTSYTFTVIAGNSAGVSAASTASNAVIPYTTPGAPTSVSAVAGVGAATVSFTPPASNGSDTITAYTITSSPGGLTATGSSSPISISGLTGGTSYTFTVVAKNSAGNSVASTASGAVTPYNKPNAPTGVVATATLNSISVAFTAPSNNGSTITKYTVTSTDGTLTATGTTSPIVFSGLTAGSSYSFTVVATNLAGDSPASAVSNSATAYEVPDAPTSVIATRGTNSATVTFVAPNNRGSSITNYTVTSTPGGIIATGNSTSIVVAGLTAGTSYTFKVVATNAAGNSLASAASNSVIPYTTPGAPSISGKVSGSGSVTLNFTAPASNGSDTISAYTVNTVSGTFSQWDTVTAGSSITVNGLSPYTAYTFNLYAVNSAGRSTAASTSTTLTAGILSTSSTKGPASGGNQVTLTGSNFVTGMTVTIGTTAATNVVVNSPTSLSFTAPAGTPSATASDIKVTYSGNTITYIAAYTYVPSISTVTLSKGYAAGGNTIVITGSGFIAGTTVTFDTKTATSVTINSTTRLTVTVPSGAIGVVDVVVTAGTQTATFVDGYAYIPQITSISANKGSAAGGTSVTISGSGFEASTVVTVGGTNATINSRNATQLVITTPAHTASATAADLVVTTNGASATFAKAFTYQAVVNSLSSNTYSALGGQSVTVTGAGFDSGKTYIVIDNSSILANVSSLSSLTFIVPAHAATTSPLNFVVKVDSSTATLTSAISYLEVTSKSNTATLPTTLTQNAAGAGKGTYNFPGSISLIPSVPKANPDPLPANSNIRSASTAGEVFVSDASQPTVSDTQTVLYSDPKGAFINGLIFSDAGSFSFYYASSSTAKINDGAIVQSLNVEGSPSTAVDPVPIQISPTKFSGNRHVWITLRDKKTLRVVARVEAVILDNFGWSPASGFELLSISRG